MDEMSDDEDLCADEDVDDGEPASECGGFFDGDVFVCTKIGSEECDFGCRDRWMLGLTLRQIEELDRCHR